MTRLPLVAKRAEELLGSAVVATAPVAGGDVSTATRMRLSDGTTALMKTHRTPPTASSTPRSGACAGSTRPAASPSPRSSPTTTSA